MAKLPGICKFQRPSVPHSEAIVSYCERLSTFPLRGFQRNDVRPGLRITHYRKRTVIAFGVEADLVFLQRAWRVAARVTAGRPVLRTNKVANACPPVLPSMSAIRIMRYPLATKDWRYGTPEWGRPGHCWSPDGSMI